MDEQRDELLAVALKDYEERSSAGVPPPLFEYRDQLGDAWDEFVQIVDTEAELKALLEPMPPPPLGGLFGGYELLRLIGSGTTGLVYEARNSTNHRHEAIKVLKPGLEHEPDSLQRFRREVQLAQELEHPNIVRVYACGEIGGYPYCAMELVEGRSLAQALVDDTLPPPEELCRQMAGVADALAMLHRNKILHRDVKPSNIVIRKDGTFVLADFGLARAADLQRITWTGQMLGTPRYMSPEQLRGKELDPRADVYGLGATLYRVLAKRPLFDAQTVAALALKVLRERPAPLEKAAPDVASDVSRVVMKAIEPELQDRYESAAVFRDELVRVAGGEKPRYGPVSPTRRAVRKACRNWRLITIAAVVLLGVVATTAVSLYLGTDARLAVRVLPAAVATLNGNEQGRGATFDLRGKRGTFALRLERKGFLPYVYEEALGPGEEDDVDHVMVIADANDAEAAAILREALEADALLKYDAAHRGGGEDLVAVFPQKTVRRADLRTWRVEINPEIADLTKTVGRLRFTAEDGSVLAEVPVRGGRRDGVVEGPMPPDLLAKLIPGKRVRWDVEVDGERSEVVAFTLEELTSEDAARWNIIEDRARGQPEGIRAWLWGSFLAKRGFYQGALQAMRHLGAEQPDLPPWVVARETTDWLGLGGTLIDAEVRKRVDDFPEHVRAAWERRAPK